MGNFFQDFFSGPEVKAYQDPWHAQLQGIIQQLNSGDLGKQFAANTSGMIRRQAADNLRSFANSGVGRNASVLSRLSDKAQTNADYDITNAQLKGAEYDTQNKERSASLMQNERNFEYNDWARQDAERRQPTPFESLLNTAVGSFAGGASAAFGAKLLGDGAKPNANVNVPNLPSFSVPNMNTPIPNVAPPSSFASPDDGQTPFQRRSYQYDLEQAGRTPWQSGVEGPNYFDRLRQ